MKKRKRGLKRHETLQPLSRHHMIALHVALKLSRAGTEKSKLTEEEIKQEVEEFWVQGGQDHFREEEEILLPVYAQYGSVDQPVITEMLTEHVKIRSLVDRIIKSAETDISIMHKLGSMLEAHVRKEERVIFPMIEKALPEQVLKEMAPYLHD